MTHISEEPYTEYRDDRSEESLDANNNSKKNLTFKGFKKMKPATYIPNFQKKERNSLGEKGNKESKAQKNFHRALTETHSAYILNDISE